MLAPVDIWLKDFVLLEACHKDLLLVQSLLAVVRLVVLSEAHLGLVELRQGILAVAEIAADTFVEKLEELEPFQLFVLDFVVA